MPQNEEGFGMEWICAWVPCTDYPRERERERERSRKAPINRYIKRREKNGTYAWKMHDHVTCNSLKHHEFSLIQTYQHTRFQQRNHTSIMYEILWKCKCDAMHEQIGSFKHNPTHQFWKTPKIFSKTQKPRSKYMKCMKKEGERNHTRGKTGFRLKTHKGRWKEWDRSVWDKFDSFSVERDMKKMKTEIALKLFKEIASRWIEDLSRMRFVEH